MVRYWSPWSGSFLDKRVSLSGREGIGPPMPVKMGNSLAMDNSPTEKANRWLCGVAGETANPDAIY